MDATSSFQTKILRQTESPADYNLYIAALEWSIIEPIQIENGDDLRSKQLWSSKLSPYAHQINNLISFCRRLPVTLIADDVGLGKTITAGLIVSELISRGRIFKILIVCPKILIIQWQNELTNKFGLSPQGLIGNELDSLELTDEVNIIITTYNSARLHFDSLSKAGFEMLVLDEAHKLRNLYGIAKSPEVAKRFKQAFEEHIFKYVLMLTATPIHNRLWDIYSLIDLLTVARGTENPFGTEGMFASNYILDDRTKARKLNPAMEEKFRSIVYGYMTRTRRNQINLFFPTRKIEHMMVDRTPEEIELFYLIVDQIRRLPPLSQCSLLQAYVSSPQAIAKEFENMAEKGSVPHDFASSVRAFVKTIKRSAKLNGLNILIDKVRAEQLDTWRVVIFTGRRETQTAIQEFLIEKGIVPGLINGDSSLRNQEVIDEFNKSPVTMHVIVSTEAGSEGLNLQVANVLMNYDLPWNPMTVEQRIGRMQRLASVHATVTVLNITLKDTFEEKIVARLMEKLQMASHAVGDIESLLQQADLNNDDESESFEEKIRALVLASLAGKDTEKATAQELKSIEEARLRLEEQEKNINVWLGDPNEYIYHGPKCPKLTAPSHSMDPETFITKALPKYDIPTQIAVKEENLAQYKLGSVKLDRLVSKITDVGLHQVYDEDKNIYLQSQELAKNWVNSFGCAYTSCTIEKSHRRFTGTAILRSRVTVAYDSYEKLIEVKCDPSNTDFTLQDVDDINQLETIIKSTSPLRLSSDFLISMANCDDSVSEFCRFYKERLDEEIVNVGENITKRKKLEDDLNPKKDIALVALEGKVNRQILLSVVYHVNDNFSYKSLLTIVPSTNEILLQPHYDICSVSGKKLPIDCLAKCEISGKLALQSLLSKSEISGRLSLPEFSRKCEATGKLILADEAEKSDITGKLVAKSYLKKSQLSGKVAEPEFFAKCEFTLSDVLKSELAASQISGRQYRIDDQMTSAVTGITGDKQEFTICAITKQPLLPSEGEKCDVTGKIVMPGLLEVCAVTGKKVLPSELEMSAVSGKKGLKRFFVTSSVSDARLFEEEAIRSSTGKFCMPIETRTCFWSGKNYHPDDLRVCNLTGLTMHFSYMKANKSYAEPLCDLLNGVITKNDKSGLWDSISSHLSKDDDLKNSIIVNAILSPDELKLALRLKIRKWFGFKTEYKGLYYSIPENSRVGRIVRCIKND